MPDQVAPGSVLAAPDPAVLLPSPGDLTFILDTPADKDVLDVHAPVAKAITQVIRTRRSIKMIGLLGGWGSGKSTVAQLARDQLEAGVKGQPVLRCFTFDAWVHQSDPPRLAFLDALADYLQTDTAFTDLQKALENKKNPPTWRRTLDKLKVQAETNTTTSTPTLTKPGRWLAFALIIAMPIGFKLIGDGTLGLPEQRDPVALIMFLAGWVAAALPGLVVLIFYLSWRRWSELRKIHDFATFKDFFGRHREEHKDQSILAVVSGKTVENRSETRHKTPDPSAIEFQGAFREMIAAAHTDNRRLVLIVDNLDRLPPAEAKVFWSTVRSLFLGTDAGRPIKREDLPTVLMPIDAGSIEKIYEGKPDDAERLGRSFLEKTFDLVFYVPAPILSRWHRYLHLKLRDVFGDKIPADWFPLIGGIYERHLDGKRPTPRSINGFVNGLAALWLQREGDPIHIGIIAYYVTIRDALTDYDEVLKTDVEELTAIDPEWRRDIAALHYGLTRVDAAELAMADPIRDALVAYDEPAFAAKFDMPGFERYFLKVLRTPNEDGRVLPVLSAAWLLSRRPIQPWTAEAWRRLRAMAVDIPSVGAIVETDAEGLRALLASAPDAERSRLARRLLEILGTYSEKAITGEGAKHFAQLAQVVLEVLPPDSDDVVQAPGRPPEYVRLLGAEPPIEVLRRIRPPGGNYIAIQDELTGQLNNALDAADVGSRARMLITVAPSTLDWAPLVEAIGETLQASDAWRVSAGLAAIVQVHEPLTKRLAKRLEEWKSDGRLVQAFNTIWPTATEHDVANIVALMIAADQSFSPEASPSWPERLKVWPDLPQLAEIKLSQMGWSFRLEGLLTAGASTDADAPLSQALALRTLDSRGLEDLELKQVFDDTPKYLKLPDTLQHRLWNALAERQDYWKGLAERPAAAQRQVFPALMKHLKSRSKLGKVVAAHLNTAPTEEWADAIHNAGGPWGLIQAIQNDMPQSQGRLGERAFRALRDTLPAMLGTSDDAVRDRWFAIAARLEEPMRETLFKSLASAIGPLAGQPEVLRLLELGGGDLIKYGLGSQPDRTVVDLVIPMAGNEQGRRWLAANAGEVRNWVNGADTASGDTLRAVLTGASGDTSADALLIALKTKPRPTPKSTTEPKPKPKPGRIKA